ncbi:hypothetical protein E2C01_010661 [Portunus trituberculatus]|uniref:Uncharacterized protein n=1 Tax=Portunus trituberculatus TaxID=210409 RepID=A0A5B7D9G4_PORTR|nr:hypothetical protein [Portunus trituberculatus]
MESGFEQRKIGVTVGDESRDVFAGKRLRCSQTLTGSSYKSLPTIVENSVTDAPKCDPSLNPKNGAPSLDPKPEEGGSNTSNNQTSYMAKVQRSVSFGQERVRPIITIHSERLDSALLPPPSPSHPPASPAVMDILLPVLKVESCENDAMQQR